VVLRVQRRPYAIVAYKFRASPRNEFDPIAIGESFGLGTLSVTGAAAVEENLRRNKVPWPV
jgi:hypothetical protein